MDVDLQKLIEHRTQVLDAIISAAQADPRIRTVMVVGSLASGAHDAYSDIDLVLVPETESVKSVLADRRSWPAQFGDVLLQLDSSWNVWSGASQVLTLLEGELPLWIDMDICSIDATPRDARIVAGAAPPPIDMLLSELATQMKERHGPGEAAPDNPDGVFDAARVAWRLKDIARGNAAWLQPVRDALKQPWAADLERVRESLRRYATHVGVDERNT